MPRYYEGDINGEFTFTQPHYCMEQYGAICVGQRVLFSCGCYDDGLIGDKYYNDFNEIKHMYCENCFESKKDAKSHLEPDEKVADLDGLVNFIITRQAFVSFAKPVIQEHTRSKNDADKKRIMADVNILKQIEKYFSENDNNICSWVSEEEGPYSSVGTIEDNAVPDDQEKL